MKFFVIITTWIACAFFTLVSSQGAGIYFTSPTLGISWKAGYSHNISWTKAPNTTATTIDTLELRNGPTFNLVFVETISNGSISISDGSYKWAIPSNTAANKTYVILARNSAGTSYSAYFTIFGTSNTTMASPAS